jgi:hypothetical protein
VNPAPGVDMDVDKLVAIDVHTHAEPKAGEPPERTRRGTRMPTNQ